MGFGRREAPQGSAHPHLELLTWLHLQKKKEKTISKFAILNSKCIKNNEFMWNKKYLQYIYKHFFVLIKKNVTVGSYLCPCRPHGLGLLEHLDHKCVFFKKQVLQNIKSKYIIFWRQKKCLLNFVDWKIMLFFLKTKKCLYRYRQIGGLSLRLTAWFNCVLLSIQKMLLCFRDKRFEFL